MSNITPHVRQLIQRYEECDRQLQPLQNAESNRNQCAERRRQLVNKVNDSQSQLRSTEDSNAHIMKRIDRNANPNCIYKVFVCGKEKKVNQLKQDLQVGKDIEERQRSNLTRDQQYLHQCTNELNDADNVVNRKNGLINEKTKLFHETVDSQPLSYKLQQLNSDEYQNNSFLNAESSLEQRLNQGPLSKLRRSRENFKECLNHLRAAIRIEEDAQKECSRMGKSHHSSKFHGCGSHSGGGGGVSTGITFGIGGGNGGGLSVTLNASNNNSGITLGIGGGTKYNALHSLKLAVKESKEHYTQMCQTRLALDGKWYKESDFLRYYNDRKRWNTAPSANPSDFSYNGFNDDDTDDDTKRWKRDQQNRKWDEMRRLEREMEDHERTYERLKRQYRDELEKIGKCAEQGRRLIDEVNSSNSISDCNRVLCEIRQRFPELCNTINWCTVSTYDNCNTYGSLKYLRNESHSASETIDSEDLNTILRTVTSVYLSQSEDQLFAIERVHGCLVNKIKELEAILSNIRREREIERQRIFDTVRGEVDGVFVING